jgi:Zn ribbon nucleic-acid-binding protein
MEKKHKRNHEPFLDDCPQCDSENEIFMIIEVYYDHFIPDHVENRLAECCVCGYQMLENK